MDQNQPGQSPYFMKSLAMGLRVLLTMAEFNRPMALTEIARAVGTNNATATRCCYTLSSLGFVSRDANRKFHLTPAVLLLGYAAISRLGWRQAALHHLERLFAEIKETVNLSILEGAELLYICRLNTDNILPYDLQIGSKLPLHCTSMGKALMAFTPPDKFDELLERIEFKALTHRTITNKQDYLAELETVRRRGYSVNDEELSVGLRSAAAPILNKEGWAMAALNVAVPTKRVSRSELEERLAPKAMQTARDISQAVAALDNI